MCGIVGYAGRRSALPILIAGLKRLEYRGYDSCGLALLDSGLKVFKDKGRIGELEKRLPPDGNAIVGIGHTRWATHGVPSPVNAHPHLDCTNTIAVVHNGTIANFQPLKEQLMEKGHCFVSETDTEVLAHLIEQYYQGNLEQAVERALSEVEGSYAIIVLRTSSPELVVARRESPLVIGLGERENFVASDVPALLDYTDRVLYLEDGDIGIVTDRGVKLDNSHKTVSRPEHRILWTVEDAQKGGYEHFMLKEIHEQPRVLRDTFKGRLFAVEPAINLGIDLEPRPENILLLACGTSYHAALVGKYLLERLARIPTRAEMASEFNSAEIALSKSLAIGITQSGETADTLKALKKAKGLGCRSLAITNAVGSSATRLADQVFYIRAGPEIGVAATKSFLAQLTALYLLSLALAPLETTAREKLARELMFLPTKVQQVLDGEAQIAALGKRLAQYQHVFFVARGINFPVALEGALKLKEISYIHAEGYPAGELKHGPLALLTPQTPVIALAARDKNYETMLSNIREIKARESPVIALAEEGDREVVKCVDEVIFIPKVDPLFSPVVNSVALQFLAYYTAREAGCPIDQPRNLAKSVTVE